MKKFIQSNKSLYLKLFSNLIAAKSVNPPGDEILVSEIIIDFLKQIGASYSIYSKNNKRPNIIVNYGSGDKSLGIATHMDVVPVGEGWLTNPFVLTKKGDKLFGRGVSDDKGPLLSTLILLHYLIEKNVSLNGRLILIFSSDEEKGGSYGLKYLLEQKVLDLDSVIIADIPGMLKKISVAEKASLTIKVVAKGVQWHSAYSEFGGLNAISVMSQFLSKIKGFVLKHDPHKFLSSPSIEPVFISGGLANNIIPDLCEARLNIRYIVGQTVEGIIKELKFIAKDIGTFEFEVISSSMPFEIDVDQDLIRTITNVAAKHGIKTILAGQNGGTDAKKFVFNGIPAIGYSFPEPGVAHQVNEWIYEKHLFLYANILGDIVLSFLNSK